MQVTVIIIELTHIPAKPLGPFLIFLMEYCIHLYWPHILTSEINAIVFIYCVICS